MRRPPAYVADHDAHLLVDGEDPRISTGAATMALELTDAVEAGAPAAARDGRRCRSGNGALINGVGVVAARRRLPTCRVVGIARPGRPR